MRGGLCLVVWRYAECQMMERGISVETNDVSMRLFDRGGLWNNVPESSRRAGHVKAGFTDGDRSLPTFG